MSTINLLPEDYLARRSQQRANVLCLVLFAVVIAGVVGAAVVSEDKASQARANREEVNAQYREASQLIAQMQQLEAKKSDVIAKAQMASELFERVPRSCLLATLTNALPPGGSLTRVRLKTERPNARQQVTKGKSKFRARRAQRTSAKKKTSVKRPPLKVTLEVMGLAQTDVEVAQFLANMQNCPLMKSVEMGFSEEEKIGEAIVRKFNVTMELKPDAHVATEKAASAEAPRVAASTERDGR